VPSRDDADRHAPITGRAPANEPAAAGPPDRLTFVVGMAAALIVVAPYCTLGLPFRAALVAQGVAVFGLVAIVAVAALLSAGWWERVIAAPAPVRFGLAAWSAAAALGAVVGVLHGNDMTLLAGQLLGMGLLPLAAAAGLGLKARGLWRGPAVGIAVAGSFAAVLHVGLWIWHAARGEEMARMYLPNAATPIGASALAALLMLALRAGASPKVRRATAPALAVIGLFVIGTEVRSLWLALAVGVVAWVVCDRGWRGLVSRRILMTAATMVAAAGVVVGGLEAWWAAPRPNLARPAASEPSLAPHASGPASDTAPSRIEGESWTWSGSTPAAAPRHTETFPVSAGEVYRVRAQATAIGNGQGFLDLVWRDEHGDAVGAMRASLPLEQREGEVTATGTAPGGATRATVVAASAPGAAGPWSVERLSVERLRPNVVAGVWKAYVAIGERLRALVQRDRNPDANGVYSIDYRIKEARAVAREFRSSRWYEMLAGRGLGARIHLGEFAVLHFGSEWVSYLHNFYLFALIKLGLVGFALTVGSLAAWTAWTWRQARTSAPGRERSFLAAMAGVWIASAVWGTMVPQFSAVHGAPLLGLLLAGSVVAAQRRPG